MNTAVQSSPVLFRKVITPDEQCGNIAIPKEWFGMKVEVIVFPVPSNRKDAVLPQSGPFRVNREWLASMRVKPEAMTSDELIRSERDSRG